MLVCSVLTHANMKELRRDSPTIDAAVRKAVATLRKVRASLAAASQSLLLSLSLSLCVTLLLATVFLLASRLLTCLRPHVQNRPGLFPASLPSDHGLLLEGGGAEQLAHLAAKQASMETEMRERLDAMDSKLDRLLASISK